MNIMSDVITDVCDWPDPWHDMINRIPDIDDKIDLIPNVNDMIDLIPKNSDMIDLIPENYGVIDLIPEINDLSNWLVMRMT